MSEKKKSTTSSSFGNSLGGLLSAKLGIPKPTESDVERAVSSPANARSSDSTLVYSTDPRANEKCPKCRELKSECVCRVDGPLSKAKFSPVLRIEKNGRGGKTVTVIDQLPKNELFLREWCGKLKKKCGSGGTYSLDGKEGVIEIQGDHRDTIRGIFTEAGLKTRG